MDIKSRKRDLTGCRFGKLLVIKQDGFVKEQGRDRPLWLCKCDCGNEKRIRNNLLNDNPRSSKSCGCSRHKYVNLIGKTFGSLTLLEHLDGKAKFECNCCGKATIKQTCDVVGGYITTCGNCFPIEIGQKYAKLTVIDYAGVIKIGRNNASVWLCRCDCGNEKTVKTTDLKSGCVKSCGCLRTEHSVRLGKSLLGCKRPETSKKMMGNKRGLGTDRSAEKIRYKEQALKQHSENNFGEWTEERRIKQSEMMSARVKNGDLPHARNSKWQKDLAAHLVDNFIEFETEFIIPKEIRGHVYARPYDFYLPNFNLLIELNGCFWHGCKECCKRHFLFQDRAIVKDKEKCDLAIKCGYNFLTVWEHSKKDLFIIVDREINDYSKNRINFT